MQAAAHFNPGFECKHLQAVQFAAPSDSKPLNEKSVIQLHLMNIISESTVKQYLNLITVADDVGAPLVAMVSFADLGFTCRTIYFSVYTDETTYYSLSKRSRVSFSMQSGVWSCQCPWSGQNRSCLHQALCKGYLQQYHSDIFNDRKFR